MSARASLPVAFLVALLVLTACATSPATDEPMEAASSGNHPEGSTDSTSIVGIVWEWTSTTTPIEVIDVEEPTKYTLTLAPDGQAQIYADCNRGTATYTIEGSSLTFGPMAMTLAECGPESLSNRYVRDLTAAAIYFVDEGDLMIDLKADGGTMRFANSGSME